jgi:glutamate transport system substrate-binding protein
LPVSFVVVVVTAFAIAGCGPEQATGDIPRSSNPGPDRSSAPVNVGVGTDMPGIATFDPSSQQRSGFDVDLFQWLANVEPKFTPIAVDLPIKDRIDALTEGHVDLVIEAFSITDERRKSISFAGPYLETQQGVLVRAGDRRIHAVGDLSGKSVCAQEGSTSLEQLKNLGVKLTTTEATGVGECVDKLLTGQLDAVSTDELILRGYASENSRLTVPDLTFGAKERYGIGMPKGDVALCKQVTEKIKNFIASGTWTQFFDANFGTGLDRKEYKPDPYALDDCE